MDSYDGTQDEQSDDATRDDRPAERQGSGGRARRSRRATRPAMTPEERPTLDVLAELGLRDPQPETDDTPSDEAQPADEQAEDAAASAGVVEDEADEQTEADEQAEVEEQAEAEERAEAEDAPSDSGEQDDDQSDSDEQDDDGESLRLPATALLFQPPDLTPRRSRRRASAPAGPPEPDEAGDGTGNEDGQDPVAPEQAQEAPAQAPRSRSRRKKQQDASDDTGASDAGASDASDASDTADATADGESTDNDDGEGGEGAEDRESTPRRRRRRGGRGRRRAKANREDDAENGNDDSDDNDDSDGSSDAENGDDAADGADGAEGTEESSSDNDGDQSAEGGGSRRRRRRRSRSRSEDSGRGSRDEVTALKGSTRLEAKRQRRREGRDANRRRAIITEAEFLARRESVDRAMVVRERDGRTQIAVLEDDVLVEHYVARKTQTSMVGNVYLGRVQNVLPSMEAAFVDLGRGRNAVLYAGEVNWDAAGLEGQPRRIEQALSAGDSVMVQVTKDPIGHKGARLTSQITLAGRYLVLVPSGAMTGISRKLPDTERNRLKKLLKEIVPDGQGVIVRTAAEGASEEELRRDVERLTKTWDDIQKKVGKSSTTAPVLLKGEPELATRVVRDVFNEDFRSLTVQGDEAWKTISSYVSSVAPDLADRLHHWTAAEDVFSAHRIDEQLAKGLDRKVWLPSGGSLVIDRTEAMTVIDVNTGKFTGTGGTLEETVTRNNLEAAEEIVRQLRLRDIGGIIVIDFIDMVLESNRDLVLRRLVECLGRDRTRHQVAEVTSLGLVQMTRKRVGQGLVEAFSTTCEHCHGRGYVLHDHPVENGSTPAESSDDTPRSGRGGRGRRRGGGGGGSQPQVPVVESVEDPVQRAQVRATLAAIAAAAAHAHEETHLDEERRGEPATDAGETAQPAAAEPDADGVARTEAAATSDEAPEQAEAASSETAETPVTPEEATSPVTAEIPLEPAEEATTG